MFSIKHKNLILSLSVCPCSKMSDHDAMLEQLQCFHAHQKVLKTLKLKPFIAIQLGSLSQDLHLNSNIKMLHSSAE